MAVKQDKKGSSTTQIFVEMRQDKVCKGSIRYTDVEEGTGKNIYIKKEELEAAFGEWPSLLNIWIERDHD